MAKRVQLSSDGGTTYYTLPGNSGEISNEAGQLPDTIFGQDFESNFPGLIGWQVQANGIFKGFAGYMVGLKMTGATTVANGEACSQIGATKVYQIDDATKQIWDTAVDVTVYDNGGAVAAADIESIDYLFGKVTFDTGYTVTGPVTVDVSYLPTSSVGGARTFTLTQTANAIDETTIPEAQANDGHRIFDYGLKTVSMDLSGVYALSNGFLAKLKARESFVVEINPDNNSLAVARGIFRLTTQAQSGDVGELEEENLSLVLSVPDNEDLAAPFAWAIDAASTLSPALKEAILAWQNKQEIDVKYLPEGSTGVTGKCIVTDLSMNGGLESMNEFTVNVQGSGELSATP